MTGTPERVGLIGLGAIGEGIVELVDHHAVEDFELVAALVRDPSSPRAADSLDRVTTLDEVLEKRPHVIAEVAGHDALRTHGPEILRAGCDLIAVSVGALADPKTHDALLTAAEAGGGRLTIVSGAIGALDAIAAAALGGLSRVIHTTRKPARALLGADAEGLEAAREIFHGSAREGALRFPESINVAVAVSLAGLGLDHTEVRVIADPSVEHNRHEVVAEGSFGSLRFEIQSVPTETNPRTSRIVAMSVVRTLLSRRAPVVVG
jgi:aspartate dehydrogenase